MKNIIYILFILATLTACKKEETGKDVSLVGFVRLIDESGIAQLNYDSVNVTLLNTQTSQKPDKNGKYTFSGLQAGINYCVELSKDGYGTSKDFENQFIGNQKPGLLPTITLYQKSTNSIASIKASASNGNIGISGTMSASNTCALIFYASLKPTVSDTCYDYSNTTYYPIPFYTTYDKNSYVKYSATIYMTSAFKKGETVYIAAYVDNFYNLYSYGNYDGTSWRYYQLIKNYYYDSDLKKTIHPSAVKQQVISIVYQ